MAKAVVLFPGVRYSCDTPLLYYAGKVFARRGYEKFEVSYGDGIFSTKNLEQKFMDLRDKVLSDLLALNLEQYEDVVFVSKSIGTVFAGWCASQLSVNVRHIYLTPLEQTLPFMDPVTDIAVGAGMDEYLDPQQLEQWCRSKKIRLTMYPNVGHRLEDRDDIHRTLRIMAEIGGLYETF